MYECCGKKFHNTVCISYALECVTRVYDNYGKRAVMAKNNEGIDWKAVSHAFRAGYQLLEIYRTGDLKYPLESAEYLRDMKEGKLHPQGGAGNNVVFHDSCYLGRYNQVYDAPRDIIAATGKKAQEMNRCAADSFCCGAGGGRMWMEEKLGNKINVERAKEAVNSGARTIATACPFCMTMMTDGVKDLNKDEEITVRDIAEIINDDLSE